MSSHTFRVTLEPLNPAPESGDASSLLTFETTNHDDIIAIVERLRQRTDIAPDSAAPLGVGLKLFGEALLKHKDNPLFAPLLPHFKEFMQCLKKG